MKYVLVPVIYFLFCVGLTYLGGWALLATRGK